LSERAMDAQTVERPVHQIMTRRLICAPPGSTLCEVTELMIEHGISCVVVGTPSAIVGIVTWRDLLKAAYPGH
jgi:acetoin utilization protein AcuB